MYKNEFFVIYLFKIDKKKLLRRQKSSSELEIPRQFESSEYIYLRKMKSHLDNLDHCCTFNIPKSKALFTFKESAVIHEINETNETSAV